MRLLVVSCFSCILLLQLVGQLLNLLGRSQGASKVSDFDHFSIKFQPCFQAPTANQHRLNFPRFLKVVNCCYQECVGIILRPMCANCLQNIAICLALNEPANYLLNFVLTCDLARND